MEVAQFAPQGAHYLANVFLLAPLTGNKEGGMGLVVLRIRPTQTQHSRKFYTKCVMPVKGEPDIAAHSDCLNPADEPPDVETTV